jgi:hypothetical protein
MRGLSDPPWEMRSHFCVLLPVDDSGCQNARVKWMANWTKAQAPLQLVGRVSSKSLLQYYQTSAWATVRVD